MQTKLSAKIFIPALAAFGLWMAPTAAFAQSTDATTAPSYPVIHTVTGDFKTTDGNSGTFVETVTLNSATSKSDVTVFTRSKDQETRTDNSTTTTNADGSRTVDYNSTEYGATAAFVSQKTITKEKHGQFVGKGTYTTAAGVTGTLTTLESGVEGVNVVSTVFDDSTGAVSNHLRFVDSGFGVVVEKHIDLDAAGNVKTFVTTRYVTGGK